MTVRSRVLRTATHAPPYLVGSGPGSRGSIISQPLTQSTESYDNLWYSIRNKERRGKNLRVRDIGGPFSTEQMIYDTEHEDKRFTLDSRYAGAGGYFADGNISALTPNTTDYNNLKNRAVRYSDPVMDSWGTSAISQVIPTKSEADLAVSAAELVREGLPKLIGSGLLKSKLKDYRKVGDEYLNIEFGLKPLIREIQSTATAIVSASERIKQLERDSGRLVRRRFRFPLRDEVTESHATGAAAVPSGWANTYLWTSYQGNRRTTWDTYRVDRWFSGAFTYYLDLGERQRSELYNAADNARLLLGVKLDAEVLWNLTPWSWLADWFGNVGDIATNISHFSRDGLVMPYGYIMADSKASKSSVLHQLAWWDPLGPKSVRTTLSFHRKQRRQAHPYGFGFSDMVLDTRQTAILGALGISKAPRR